MSTFISTRTFLETARPVTVDLQNKLASAQKEVSTGRLADPGLGLGYRTGRAISLRSEADLLDTFKNTNAVAGTGLDASQAALKSIADTAQKFVDTLLVAQRNGDVSILKQQATDALQTLTAALNSSTGGAYVFGGINSAQKPVADYAQTPVSAAQSAVAGAFQTAFGVTQNAADASAITPSALTAFLNGPFATLFTGSAWKGTWSSASDTPTSARISSGETVVTSASANAPAFTQLASAYASVADLGLENLNRNTADALISSAIKTAEVAIGGLTGLRSALGISQARLANANARLDIQIKVVTGSVSDLETVDPYEASARVSSLTSELNAAYALTARLSKLSLLNFI